MWVRMNKSQKKAKIERVVLRDMMARDSSVHTGYGGGRNEGGASRPGPCW